MQKRIWLTLLAVLMVVTVSLTVVFASDADTATGQTVTADTTWYNETDTEFRLSNAADLLGLAELVNGGNTFAGKTVTLDNDIDLAGVNWDGIGIYEKSATGTPFSGTFDGANHKISNVTFVAKEYTGFFNQLYKATVQNLTVEVDGFVSGATGSYGAAAIAGHARSSTIENCVSEGAIKGTHNVAGIVVRISTAEKATTLIKGCTNKATLTSSYTKIGGIAALSQSIQTAYTIEGCVNEGAINSTGNSEATIDGGYAGIIGWAGYDGSNDDAYNQAVIIKDCENKGTISVTGGTLYGQIAGKIATFKQLENNKGIAGQAAIFHPVDGLNFATVAGGVASYVSDGALAAGNTYLVTGLAYGNEVVKPTIALTDGQSISFDTSLATIDDSGITSAVTSVEVTEKQNGNVITYSVGDVAETYVASIGQTQYTSLQAAIDAAASGDTITLIADTAENNVQVMENQNITIDLDGHTLTGYIFSKGILTVQNGTIKSETLVSGSSKSAIESCGENATLTLVNVTATSLRHAIRVEGGTATIESGTYTVLNQDATQTSHALNAGGIYTTVVTVNGGTFNGIDLTEGHTGADSGAAVMAQKNATVTINGGIFQGGQNDTLAISDDSNGVIKIPALVGDGLNPAQFDQDPTAHIVNPEGSVYIGVKGDNYYTIAKAVAQINTTYYATIQDAIDAAQNGATINVIAESIELPVINKAGLTFKTECGTKITNSFSTSADAGWNIANTTFDGFEFAAQSGFIATDLTLKNCKFTGNNGIYYGAANGTWLVESCEFTCSVYGLMVGEGNGTVAVKNTTINGGFNTFGSTVTMNFENCTFNKSTKSSYNVVQTRGNMTLTDCTIAADWPVAGDASNFGNVEVDDVTEFYNVTYTGEDIFALGEAKGVAVVNPTKNESGLYTGGTFASKPSADILAEGFVPTVDANGNYTVAEGAYVASIGDVQYASLQEAIDAAKTGETVTLLADITVSGEKFTVADGQSITLDLNGHTIAGTDTNASGNFELIANKGTLTIKDSVGDGAITLTATADRDWNAYSAVIANLGGTLTVESGTIQHLRGTDMAYAIDNNSTLGDTTLTINGGAILSNNYRAVRMFANSITNANTVAVNGGTVKGGSAARGNNAWSTAIWMQNPNAKANKASLTVSDAAKIGSVNVYSTGDASNFALAVAADALIQDDPAGVASVLDNVTDENFVIEATNGIYGIKDTNVSLYGTSITLGDRIGINFYVNISDEIIAKDGAYILFTFANEKVEMSLAGLTKEENGSYKFTAPVYSYEMTDEITAQVIAGDYQSVVFRQSVANYAATIKQNGTDVEGNTFDEHDVKLAEALLRYGAAAQNYFRNEKNDVTFSDSEQNVTIDSTYEREVTAAIGDISYNGSSVLFQSQAIIRHYFKLSNNASINDYTFTVNGKTLQPVESGGEYYVAISGINATDLDEMYTLTVTCGDNTQTITYGVYTYIQRQLSSTTATTDLQNLVKALYWYSQAAEAAANAAQA